MANRNVISFCLFGSDPMYCQGAIKNAELIKTVYPGWQMQIWLGAGVPDNLPLKLQALGVHCVVNRDLNPMLARFLVASDASVDRFLVRDTDSRLNMREKAAVDEWIASGKSFHVIADHPYHTPVMGGGLWGGIARKLDMAALITQWTGNKDPGARDSIYNHDQLFLRDMVWPLIKHDCLRHDFCLGRVYRDALPFPAKMGDNRFVGERFSADDKPEPVGWQQRINWLTA